jgi:hypothetical protein
MRHTEELGFRDFSSLFLVKENRRQLGNSECCISFIKVSSNIASLLTPRDPSAIRQDEANKYCAVFLEELPNGLQIAGLNSNGRR